MRFTHKDGRFHMMGVGTPPHAILSATTNGTVLLTHGTTQSSPQPVGATFGSSSSPNQPAQAYWAAWKLWNTRLKTSNRMLSYFTDVEILAYDTSSITMCPSSCANGWFRNMSTGRGIVPFIVDFQMAAYG